jgi:hypothetical protein
MKIGYNKVLGIVLLLLGLFNCCLGVVFVRTEEPTPAYVVGGFWLFFVSGVLLLTRNYMEVTDNTLAVKSFIGPGVKKYNFTSEKDFSVDGGNIFLLVNGERQKLPVSSWVADKSKWKAFIKWVETGGTSSS